MKTSTKFELLALSGICLVVVATIQEFGFHRTEWFELAIIAGVIIVFVAVLGDMASHTSGD